MCWSRSALQISLDDACPAADDNLCICGNASADHSTSAIASQLVNVNLGGGERRMDLFYPSPHFCAVV
jgi:hypothetical protein